MKKQLSSFKYAFKGLGYTIKNEGHFRFHLVAAIYVIYFALRFYDFSKGELAALFTLIALVLTIETVNTAIERICNKVSPTFDYLIRITKDVAAGGVLLSAVASVAVAVVLFWDLDVFSRILAFYLTHILNLVLLILSGVLSVLFIAFFPKLFKAEKK